MQPVAVTMLNTGKLLAPAKVKKQRFERPYQGTVRQVFAALVRALAFRRWHAVVDTGTSGLPVAGQRYVSQSGTVVRSGRIVEILPPVVLTLKETLDDPPCHVILTMRWRIEVAATGPLVRLQASYDFNRAAMLAGRHWERRLRENFQVQFTYIARHLNLLQHREGKASTAGTNRDLLNS
jgi:glycine/D-amino acid oxidase-like deaminating enzyme